MNNLNSLMNHHQISLLQEIQNNSQSDPSSSNDDFLQQMLSSITSPASAFPWPDDDDPQHQISSGATKAKNMLQQQLLHAAANEADAGFFPDRNDVPSFNPAILENDASIKALFNGFSGSLGQTPNQPMHFHQHQGESLGVSAAEAAASQPSPAGQPRQRVRARRGQATDPHSIAERLRRERIAERMKALQELVPNANRTDKASMLDEIIDYVKFLQLQVKVLSTSRLGGAAGVAPLLGEASSPEKKEGMKAAEQQVAKLLEEDMGSAMQYLQGKGLCLMPISLATRTPT